MNTSIAIITFPDSNAPVDSFTTVHNLDGVRGAVVVSRDAKGRIEVTLGTKPPEDETLKGGILGGLIGILGGPLGILLGWSTGTLVGQTADNAAYDDAVDGIAFLSDRITPGTSALMVEIDESDPTVLDTALTDFDARILRIPIDEVAAEVAVARDQIDEAANAARSARREARHAAYHDRRTVFHDRIKKFFDRPHTSADRPAPNR